MSKNTELIFFSVFGGVLVPLLVGIFLSLFSLYTIVNIVKAPFIAAKRLTDEIDTITKEKEITKVED